MYHPDKNVAHDAQQKFYQITEAYEIILGTRKAPPIRQTTSTHSYYHAARGRRSYNFRRQSYREMWEEETDRRRRDARRYAKEQAQRRYENIKKNNEAFRKSWYYKPAYYLVHAIIFAAWLIGLAILCSSLYGLVYFYLEDDQWWKILFCFPLFVAGVLCITHAKKLKQEAAPFFS